MSNPEPDLRFAQLAENTIPAAKQLIDNFEQWASADWSPAALDA
jgi:hypothetical protein